MAPQTIVLPTEVSEVDNSWASQKFGIIGSPGCGKSELLAQDPNSFFIQTEAGLNHLKVKKVVCRTWDDALAIRTALIQANQAGKFPYTGGNIVIDTIDEFIDCADQEVIARGKEKFKAAEINGIGDVPNGAGWDWRKTLVMNYLQSLEALPCAIWFIGHLDYKEVKKPNNTSMHKQTISIGGKLGGALLAWVDHFLNIEAIGEGAQAKRKVRTIPTSSVEAKSRGGMVQDGWLWENPTDMSREGMEKAAKANYAKLRASFK